MDGRTLVLGLPAMLNRRWFARCRYWGGIAFTLLVFVFLVDAQQSPAGNARESNVDEHEENLEAADEIQTKPLAPERIANEDSQDAEQDEGAPDEPALQEDETSESSEASDFFDPTEDISEDFGVDFPVDI